MKVIKGRLIGKKGNTLRVLGNLSNCEIAVKDNFVAVIGHAESFAEARQAVISLIQGAKQGNVYGYLEKSRTRKKQGS